MRRGWQRAAFWIACTAFALLVLAAPPGYAAGGGTVWETYNKPNADNPANAKGTAASGAEQQGGEESPGVGSILLQVAFCFGVIVVLIYLLLRVLARRQIGTQSGPFRVVGAVPLGGGKSLAVVMVGDSLYLLGVGQDVTLIRRIPAGDEMDAILADAEWKAPANERIAEWFARLRGKETAEIPYAAGEESRFHEILVRQWEDVNNRSDESLMPEREEDRNRGERP